MATRRYLCPFCKKRIDKEKLASHLSRAHSKELPENFTALQTSYHIMNKRPLEYTRKCRICGSPTAWDEKKGRYNFLCGKPACDKAWVEKMKVTMGDKMGSNRPTATAEGLQKMLAGRRISGTYKFRDGHEFTYTGTYELEALKFLDQVLEVKSEDLQVPGPVLTYPFQGKNHMYITDMYYIPYNLIIEVKDGGSNPNTNAQYALTRAKQMAKENYVIKKTDYNYLRLTDNNLSQLFTVFAELKLNMVEDEDERIIRVHEATEVEERTLDSIIFDFGNVLVYDRDPMVHNKDNLDVCYYTDKLLSSLYNKGYKLYYLSNWDQESFEYYKEKGIFDFMKYFQGGIISYEMDQVKPAVTIYKALIDKYNIDTQKALFLDDKQENIEAARSEGLIGITFDKSFVDILMGLPVIKKEVVNEGNIMNTKDIYYNKDKFDSGEINVCFVTGLSGSGKSTLANKMEKAGVEKYELDDVLANYAFTDENLKEYGEVISGYFKGPGKRFRIQPDEKDKRNEWTDREEADCVRGFIDYALKYANSHKATKFVIEGVELYWFYKPEELKEYAVYIKGTSALISMIRSAKRDSSDVSGLARVSSFLKNMFRRDRAHAYFNTETTIQKWRDYYTSVTEKSVHENMLAASQGFMLMNPNDTILINFMKHNTFTDESDYAIAFNQKFDRIFARNEHGRLQEFNTSFLKDTTYTPYIVEDTGSYMKRFLEDHLGEKISTETLYEVVLGHPMYSKDQILFEAKAKKYKDYYKMLQDTDELIAKATQPGTPEFMVPIGEATTENVVTLDINDPKAVELLKKDSYTKKYLDYLKDNTGEVIIIDNKLAGYIFVGKKKDPGFISTLEVKKEFRGKGYSKILLKDAIDKLGAIDLCVDKTNKVALNLYKKFGFVKVKSVNGDKQWYMKLKSKLNKDDEIINESHNKSELDPNFKKSSQEPYKIVDWNKTNAYKYLSEFNKEALDWNLEKRVGEIIVSTKTDDIIGYILVSKTGVIQPIHVYEKYRGQGFSKILMKDALDKFGAKKLGVYKDNEVAIRLYKSFGFKITDEKKDHYTMVKEAATIDSVLYHGSHVNIKGDYLIPKNNSHEDKDYVFGSSDRDFALCYAGNAWHDGMINQGYYNGQLYLVEMEIGMFEKVFNTDGYVYEIEKTKDFFQRGMRVEFLSEKKAKILNRTYFSNVWKEIQKANIDLYFYPDKPKWFKEHHVKESYLEERSLPKGDVTLYHGSCEGGYTKILNNSPNNGKRWENIRQSSFWFVKKEYATMFATAELLQKESNGKIYILIDNDMKTLVPEKYRSDAERIIKTKHSFVYIKTVDGKYINGGQSRNFPEYTLDFTVTPDEVYSNTYEEMRNSIKYCTDEYLDSVIQKYKKNTMTYSNSLFGQFVDSLIYDTNQELIKAKKTIKKYNESVVEDSISEPWYIKSDDGVVNCCISVPCYEHFMRGRSSMLCLKHDTGIWEVFLRKSVDDYGAPGGGWNPNESPMEAAIREAREEARLEVTNVKRMGTLIEYHEDVKDWVKQHIKNPKDWWYGYYSAVFVGLYNGKYTGEIKDIDKDPIGYEGKWYPVEDSMPGLPREYHEAIMKYIEEEEDRNNG